MAVSAEREASYLLPYVLLRLEGGSAVRLTKLGCDAVAQVLTQLSANSCVSKDENLDDHLWCQWYCLNRSFSLG